MKATSDGTEIKVSCFSAISDKLFKLDDWNDVIIAYRNGGPLRIRDHVARSGY